MRTKVQGRKSWEDREEEEATETEGEDEKLTREPPQIGEHLNILDNSAL